MRRGSAVRGPLSNDQLRQAISSGKLRLEDAISPDQERWRKIGDIPPLASLAAAAPTPEQLEAERLAREWEQQRQRAQLRAEERGRVAGSGNAPFRVEPWHYALLGVAMVVIAIIPILLPEREPVLEADCAAPAGPMVVWRDCLLPGLQAANSDLHGAILRGAALEGAVLRAANLEQADIAYADLSHAVLRGANLTGADLTGVTLRYADLSHATLRDANLSYANLVGADRERADFTGARLGNAVWENGVECRSDSVGECLR